MVTQGRCDCLKVNRFRFASMMFAGAVASQVAWGQINLEPPPIVPQEIAEGERAILQPQAVNLADRRRAVESSASDLRHDCSRVDSEDTQRVSTCNSRNLEVRQAIAEYKRDLAGFKCRLAQARDASLRRSIADIQEAIRRLGIGTTVEAF